MLLTSSLRTATAVLSALFLSATPVSAQSACNNSPSLCDRSYGNLTHLGAHNSPFLRDESTNFATSGNHYYNSTVQLDAGVRFLTAQVHKKNDTSGNDAWHLCHSRCDLLDAGTLESWLGEIKDWMDKNPNDVVTVLLVNAADARPAELGAQFEASGIDEYAYVPESTSSVPQEWPTLQSLISEGTCLMIFVASLPTPDPNYPYLMDEFTFLFENKFENEDPKDFDCVPDRPSSLSTTAEAAASGKLFLMNHFLYSVQLFGIQTPNDTYVNVTNAETGLGSLGTHLSTCTSEYNGQAPTFVLVDFFNVGPAIASVDKVNGVSEAVGRKTVSTEPLTRGGGESAAPGSSKPNGSYIAVVMAVVVAVGFGI